MKGIAEKLVTGYCWMSAFILLGSVTVLGCYLVARGFAALDLELVFGDVHPLKAVLMKERVLSGLWPAIVGTFLLVITALVFAVPIGVASGIYLAEYGKGRIKSTLSLFFDILASIPSIVVGLFGFSVAVFLHQQLSGRIYPCLLISAFSLGFLVLPYIIRTTQISLESVPVGLRRTAPALGASKLQNIRHVLLPRSFPALLSGIILATGRCAEDTAVIMLTGVVASAGIPASLLDSYEALPFYIYYISSQYADPEELAGGYGAALILVIICMLLFGMAFFAKNRFESRISRL